MTSRITQVVAIVSTTLLVALLVFQFLVNSHDHDQPPDIVFTIDPECHPDSSYSTGLASTKDGSAWYHTCVQNHGPFYVWREGKLVLRGQFVNGKKHGTFIEYALDGSVIKETHYVEGKEVKQ